MRRTLFRIPLVFAAMLLSPTPRADAATIVYTFEAPQFALGQTTPLINVAPNIGDPSFDTDFASTGFQVLNFQPNSLFSGQSLVEPQGSFNSLALLFSSPITALQVDYGLNTMTAGQLTLVSPVGTATSTASNVGGVFLGGTLVFTSSTPFSFVQLSASGPTGFLEFAIDDLTLTTVSTPEPTSLLLLGTGVLGVGVRRWRQKRT